MKELMVRYREKRGYTQKQAAEALGVSQALVARAESEEGFMVSPRMAIQLEKLSDGELLRSELRPDIWDGIAA